MKNLVCHSNIFQLYPETKREENNNFLFFNVCLFGYICLFAYFIFHLFSK